MNYISKLIRIVMAVVLSGCLWSSCNDEVVDTLRKDYPENGSVYNKGHVLWIVLDGASGTAVKQANNNRKMPTLRNMLKNSLYTFNGLADTRSDTVVSETLGWDNLLTGVEKHTAETPSVFRRMKEISPKGHISLYATTDYLYKVGKNGSDTSVKATSDEEAVSSLTTTLSKDDEIADLTVLELNNVQKTGDQYGFLQSEGENAGQPTDEVLNALNTVDGHINRVIETLKNRPAYNQENWLVVIASNYGGSKDNAGSSVFEMKDRNTFCLMYNDKFTTKLQLAPAADEGQAYSFFTPLYSALNGDYAKVNDPALFDFKFDSESKDTTSYTVQFLYRSERRASRRPGCSIVSKAVMYAPGKYTEGWDIVRDWGNTLPHLNGSRWSSENKNSDVNNGKWHVCTYVFDYKKKQFRQYTNGILTNYGGAAYTDLNGSLATDSAASLTIGKIFNSPSYNETFYVTELQVYDIALPADYIAKNYKLTALDQQSGFPYWNNLIGYWPCDREEDFKLKVLKDYSKYGSVYGGINAGRSDMTLSYGIRWEQGSSVDEHVQPAFSRSYYQSTFNVVDIPYQTLQWLGLSVPTSWGWSGIARTLPYMDLNNNN